jgi:hypothetical protein
MLKQALRIKLLADRQCLLIRDRLVRPAALTLPSDDCNVDNVLHKSQMRASTSSLKVQLHRCLKNGEPPTHGQPGESASWKSDNAVEAVVGHHLGDELARLSLEVIPLHPPLYVLQDV